MPKITQDESRWPRVYITMTGQSSAQDVHEWMPRFLALTKRQEPFAAIYDLTTCAPPTREAGTLVKEYMDPEREALRKYVVEVAMVVSSGAIRVALNAMLLFVRAPYPTRVVTSMAEAEAYCDAQMKGIARASA